jgi:hypothetical protein
MVFLEHLFDGSNTLNDSGFARRDARKRHLWRPILNCSDNLGNSEFSISTQLDIHNVELLYQLFRDFRTNQAGLATAGSHHTYLYLNHSFVLSGR